MNKLLILAALWLFACETETRKETSSTQEPRAFITDPAIPDHNVEMQKGVEAKASDVGAHRFWDTSSLSYILLTVRGNDTLVVDENKGNPTIYFDVHLDSAYFLVLEYEGYREMMIVKKILEFEGNDTLNFFGLSENPNAQITPAGMSYVSLKADPELVFFKGMRFQNGGLFVGSESSARYKRVLSSPAKL